MTELAAGLATMSLYLLWRLYVVSKRSHMTEILLRGIVKGKVEIRKTEDGIEMEVKQNV